jgi:hypothetical protein
MSASPARAAPIRARRSPRHCVDGLVVPLNSDGGKNHRTFLVEVLRFSHIGRRPGVADVCLMGLGQHRELMPARVIQYRNQDREIGGMGTAEIGRIVQKGVARPKVGVQVRHAAGHDIGARHDVDGNGLGRRQELGISRQQAAGAIVAAADDARSRRTHQRMLHLARNGVEAPRQDRQQHRIHDFRPVLWPGGGSRVPPPAQAYAGANWRKRKISPFGAKAGWIALL